MRTLPTVWAGAACISMVISPGYAALPVQPPAIIDVALAAGGELRGQVVDSQGNPVSNTIVTLTAHGRPAVQADVGGSGEFLVSDLRAGVYEAATPDGRGVYRAWAPGTAPPGAAQRVMLVSQRDMVRGQFGPPPEPVHPAPAPAPGPFGRAANWVSNHPFITAGIVAAAVAIPIAIAADDDDDAS